MPEISIVIPAYNAEKYLAETIESVLAQTFSDWELVIVDDGSTDATAAIAQSYRERDPRIRLVRQENRGLPGARNRGYAESDPGSACLIFLDADDVWEREALAALRDAHRADPEARLVFGLARYIDARGRPVDPAELDITLRERHRLHKNQLLTVPWEAPADFESLVFNNAIRTPGLALIPRSTLQTVGLFDLEGGGVADWDLWLRIALHGRIAVVPQVLLAYRLHADNMSKGREKMIAAELRMRKKTITSRLLTPAQRARAIEAYCFVYLRGDHLRWITPARRLLLAALRGEAPSPAQLPNGDGTEWEFPLLAALQGDAALAEKLMRFAEHPEKKPALTPEERRALVPAYRALCRMDYSIRRQWFLEFIKQGRLVPAAKHIYHGIPSLCRLAGAHLLPLKGRETAS